MAWPTGLDGTGPHGIRITTPTGRTHDATAPPILGEGWPEPRPDDWLDDDGTQFVEWLENARVGHCRAA